MKFMIYVQNKSILLPYIEKLKRKVLKVVPNHLEAGLTKDFHNTNSNGIEIILLLKIYPRKNGFYLLSKNYQF